MALVAPTINLKRKMTAYEILSVNPKSFDRHHEIKKNYRALSLKHHPDKGGVAEVFQKVNEAYTLIGDTAKRIEYDHRHDEAKLIDMSPVITKLGLRPVTKLAKVNLPEIAHASTVVIVNARRAVNTGQSFSR